MTSIQLVAAVEEQFRAVFTDAEHVDSDLYELWMKASHRRCSIVVSSMAEVCVSYIDTDGAQSQLVFDNNLNFLNNPDYHLTLSQHLNRIANLTN